MKISTVALFLAFLFQASRVAALDPNPKGDPFFSIRQTKDGSGAKLKPTGYFFYTIEVGDEARGPILVVRNLSRGKSRGEIFGGSQSAEIVEQIYAVKFEPFDMDDELKAAREAHAKAVARGDAGPEPIVLDGAEYEISYNRGETHFKWKAWNPGETIDFFAPYSPKIAKLKNVVDILALYYGKTSFGL
jgi:hypothetical protein